MALPLAPHLDGLQLNRSPESMCVVSCVCRRPSSPHHCAAPDLLPQATPPEFSPARAYAEALTYTSGYMFSRGMTPH